MLARRLHHRFVRLAVTFAITALAGAPALAQSGQSDASAVMTRMRAARTEHNARTLAATFASKATVNVRETESMIDLIKPQMVVMVAAGTYHRDPTVGTRVRIDALKSTAPIAGIARGPIENIQSLVELIDITDQEIVLLNTAFVSPLGPNADDHYVFTLGTTEKNGSTTYDVVKVTPRSSLRPLFEGTLHVVSSTTSGHPLARPGSLARLELRPSSATVVPFIESLVIRQNFDHAAVDGIRMKHEVSGVALVRFATLGIAETRMDFASEYELRELQLDVPMPGALRAQTAQIVIDDAAAVAGAERLTHAAREEIETIEASVTRHDAAQRRVALTFGGMIDYNRAGGATPTASAGVAYGPVALSGSGGYSFGLKRPVGEATIGVTVGDVSSLTATLRGSAFSTIATTSTGDKSYPRIMNTLVSATLHQDYYNFMRKDGWNSSLELGYGKLRLGLTYEQARHFSIGNNAVWSLLTMASKEFPINPPITDGSFRTLHGELAFSRVAPFLKLTPVGDDDLRWSLSGMTGSRVDSSAEFRLLEALASYSLPIMKTGYNPMTLTLLAAAGSGTASLPPQYQFRLRTSAASFGKPGGFVSPPKGLYGGTEYVSLGGEINLTDLPWRAIGLPTHNGRGIELILAGGAARYLQAHPVGFSDTDGIWYSEAGVALSRIPLFITEIVYGRVDVRKGFGPLGKFGANFTFVLPL